MVCVTTRRSGAHREGFHRVALGFRALAWRLRPYLRNSSYVPPHARIP